MKIGERLKDARESLGWKQEQLAKKTGLSAEAIGKIERGVTKSPFGTTVSQLEQALGVSLREKRPGGEHPRSVQQHFEEAACTDMVELIEISRALGIRTCIEILKQFPQDVDQQSTDSRTHGTSEARRA